MFSMNKALQIKIKRLMYQTILLRQEFMNYPIALLYLSEQS